MKQIAVSIISIVLPSAVLFAFFTWLGLNQVSTTALVGQTASSTVEEIVPNETVELATTKAETEQTEGGVTEIIDGEGTDVKDIAASSTASTTMSASSSPETTVSAVSSTTSTSTLELNAETSQEVVTPVSNNEAVEPPAKKILTPILEIPLSVFDYFDPAEKAEETIDVRKCQSEKRSSRFKNTGECIRAMRD